MKLSLEFWKLSCSFKKEAPLQLPSKSILPISVISTVFLSFNRISVMRKPLALNVWKWCSSSHFCQMFCYNQMNYPLPDKGTWAWRCGWWSYAMIKWIIYWLLYFLPVKPFGLKEACCICNTVTLYFVGSAARLGHMSMVILLIKWCYNQMNYPFDWSSSSLTGKGTWAWRL